MLAKDMDLVNIKKLSLYAKLTEEEIQSRNIPVLPCANDCLLSNYDMMIYFQ